MSNDAWQQALTTLVEGFEVDADADDILESLLSLTREASDSRATFAFLSGLGPQWLCEGVDEAATAKDTSGGSLAVEALGVTFGPVDDAVLAALRSGKAVVQPGQAQPGVTGSASVPVATEPSWQETLGISGQVLLVPLHFGTQLEGCLALWRPEGPSFSQEERERASQIAFQAMVGMQMLQRAEAERNRELQEERERIARDLHDLAIQGIFASGMKLERLKHRLSESVGPITNRSEFAGEVAEALVSLEASVSQIRGIVYGLRGENRTEDLADRLRHEASAGRGNLGFAPTFVVEVDGAAPSGCILDTRVDEKLSGDIVAVVREALSNAARHARATSVRVSVEVFGTGPSGEVVVGVIDDGAGLDPARTRNSGLANMQRRATLRGGSFSVGSGPRGRGTSLVWRAPLA